MEQVATTAPYIFDQQFFYVALIESYVTCSIREIILNSRFIYIAARCVGITILKAPEGAIWPNRGLRSGRTCE